MSRYTVKYDSHVYSRGQQIKIPVEVRYNKELDNVFGRGYAFKCAKITARQNKGQLFDGNKEIEL